MVLDRQYPGFEVGRAKRLLVTLALLGSMQIVLVACQTSNSTHGEPPVMPDVIEMAVGDTLEFGFPADAMWHYSGVMTQVGQRYSVRPGPEASRLAPNALRFRMGDVPHLVRAGDAFDVTMPGRLGFRVDDRHVSPSVPTASVTIERVR